HRPGLFGQFGVRNLGTVRTLGEFSLSTIMTREGASLQVGRRWQRSLTPAWLPDHWLHTLLVKQGRLGNLKSASQVQRFGLATPQALGYGFSTWNVPRLAAHLKKLTKVGFSADQLRRLLNQEGFSNQRPKHTMRGRRNETDSERAQVQL